MVAQFPFYTVHLLSAGTAAALFRRRAVAISSVIGGVAVALFLVRSRVHRRLLSRLQQRRQSEPSGAAAYATFGPADARVFSPLASVLAAIEQEEACDAGPGGGAAGGSPAAVRVEASTRTEARLSARRAFVREATTKSVTVPLSLWIAYRLWVDTVISARAGRAEAFHSFVYAHTLGLPNPSSLKTHWSGSDAADLLACLAAEGLLGGVVVGGGVDGGVDGASAPSAREALHEWLKETLYHFDSRFLLARDRVYKGLTYEVCVCGPRVCVRACVCARVRARVRVRVRVRACAPRARARVCIDACARPRVCLAAACA